MEKDTTVELLSQGNPRCSNQTSFSIQRTLVHMDNFQRVGQSRTQNMLEE